MRTDLRDLLEAPARLERALENARLETRFFRERCECLVGKYGTSGGGRAFADARDGAASALADAMEAEEQAERALREAEATLEAFLGRVRREAGVQDACLLRSRYLLRRTWPQVQRDLEERFGKKMTLRTVHNRHRAALERAETVWEEERNIA